MAEPTHRLDYDVPVRRGSKRPVYVFCAAIVGVVLLCVINSKGPIWLERWREFWGDRTTMRYAPPPGTVAFSNDPAMIPALSALGPGYAVQQDPFPYAGFIAPATIEGFQGWNAVPFMHGRTVAPNPQRLVAVTVQPWRGDKPTERIVLLMATTLAPATLAKPRQWLYGSGERMLIGIRDSDTLTIMTGKPDPSDAAHFTIEVIANGSSFIVNGRLRPDDSVQLIPHGGLSMMMLGGDPIPEWWPTAMHFGNNPYDPLDQSAPATPAAAP